MYQLVPVALQVKIRYRKLTYPQYGLYAVGVLGLAFSLYVFKPALLAIFGTLTVIGALMFIFNMVVTTRSAEKGTIKTAVLLALAFLFLTVLLGLTLALDFYRPFLKSWHERLFHVHILFGTLGWFTLLIMGLSFKLAPMFTLSHKYESGFAPASIHFLHTGIWVAALGFLFHTLILSTLGGVIVFFGIVCYGIQMKKVVDHRLKKKYDLGIKISLLALPFSLALIILSIVYGLAVSHAFPTIAVVYVIIIGWIAFVILGYLYKIIPFLWWTYKYGEKAGQKGVPLLKEMMSETRGQWWFAMFLIAIIINTAALVLHLATFAFITQSLFLLSSVCYTLELANVLRK